MILVRIYFLWRVMESLKPKWFIFNKKKHMNKLVSKIFINIVFCSYKYSSFYKTVVDKCGFKVNFKTTFIKCCFRVNFQNRNW